MVPWTESDEAAKNLVEKVICWRPTERVRANIVAHMAFTNLTAISVTRA